jgi:hypothetical protein
MPFQSYVQLTMLDQHLHASHQPIKLMERSIFSARYLHVHHVHPKIVSPSIAVRKKEN